MNSILERVIIIFTLFFAMQSHSSVCTQNVSEYFTQLNHKATESHILDNALFNETPVAYTSQSKNNFGIDNHFQGIATRLNALYISGADIKTKSAELFVGKRVKNHTFELVKKIKLNENNYWHAGGISIFGNILAVPIENTRKAIGEIGAKILFYDILDELNPKTLQSEIDLPGKKAHAVAYGVYGANRQEIIASWDDTRLLFFKRDGLKSRFQLMEEMNTYTLKSHATDEIKEGMHAQGIQFINQCDGKLFLVAFNNTTSIPFIPGTNYIDIFEVNFDKNDITKIAVKTFECPLHRCHFSAAANIGVNRFLSFSIFSIPHFRNLENGLIYFQEFN